VPSVRTFIAIELTPALLTALEGVQDRLRQRKGGEAGRWVRKEGIHLTLKFLGDVPEDNLTGIYEGVARACMGNESFALTATGVGCFPNSRRPRVIWVGIREDTGNLERLQKLVDGELGRLGYPKDRRAFSPHLTLARVRRRASRAKVEALGRSVANECVGELARMQVDAVSVMKSDLTPQGAIYTELFRSPLGAHE
jgi:2'-5' RNA ligase